MPMIAKSERYIKTDVVLGEGGYKTVTKAIDVEEGKEVAYNEVKIKQYELETQTQSSFSKEIALLKTINHPNILKILDYWFDGDNFIFITELMSGGSLADFIRSSGKVNSNVIRKWGTQILQGLAHLHTNEYPIIHRDIKNENIFINGPQGEVKIGDLGIARERKHRRYTLVGTITGMSREMFEGDGYNEKVDIYAFGMCAIQMATGMVPYSECTEEGSVKRSVMQGILPLAIQDIEDNCLKSLVLCCLVSSKNRYSAKQCLQHHFFHPNVVCEGDCIPRECSTVLPLCKEEDVQLSLIAFIENTITLQIQIKDYTIKDNLKFIKFDYDLENDTVEKVCEELLTAHVLEDRPLNIVRRILQGGVEKCIKKRDAKKIIDGIISLDDNDEAIMDSKMWICNSRQAFGSKTLEIMREMDLEMEKIEKEKEKERKRDEELTQRLKAKIEHKDAKYEVDLGSQKESSETSKQNQDGLFVQANKVSSKQSINLETLQGQMAPAQQTPEQKNGNGHPDSSLQGAGQMQQPIVQNSQGNFDSSQTNQHYTASMSPSSSYSTQGIYSPQIQQASNVIPPNYSVNQGNNPQQPQFAPQGYQNMQSVDVQGQQQLISAVQNLSIESNPHVSSSNSSGVSPSVSPPENSLLINPDTSIANAIDIYSQYMKARTERSSSNRNEPSSPQNIPLQNSTILSQVNSERPSAAMVNNPPVQNNLSFQNTSPGHLLNNPPQQVYQNSLDQLSSMSSSPPPVDPDHLLQKCFNITRKKYLNPHSMIEVCDDAATITGRGDEYAKSWAGAFSENDISTVFDLKLLSFEDWERLPLTVFAHRALQDMIFGFHNVPLKEKQFATNPRIKDYHGQMQIGEFISDLCISIGKEEFAGKWERALISQDIRTVEELKRLHPEDWNRLGVTVYCYRILKNVIFKKGKIVYEN